MGKTRFKNGAKKMRYIYRIVLIPVVMLAILVEAGRIFSAYIMTGEETESGTWLEEQTETLFEWVMCKTRKW